MLLDLLLTFMKIGVLAFGGGYAALPLIQDQVVNARGWMTFAEFSDLLAIDELTPGPIIVNAATFVGVKLAGIPGAVAATLGSVLPSCIIAFLFARIYLRFRDLVYFEGALAGLRAMVTGLIGTAAVSAFTATVLSPLSSSLPFDPAAAVICALAFAAFRLLETDPVVIMLGCGAAGLLAYGVLRI